MSTRYIKCYSATFRVNYAR